MLERLFSLLPVFERVAAASERGGVLYREILIRQRCSILVCIWGEGRRVDGYIYVMVLWIPLLLSGERLI